MKMTPKEYVDWFWKKFKPSIGIAQDLICPKVDHVVLIELIEKYNIKSVLEFGTYQGATSLLMWLHPNIERIKTIDSNIWDGDSPRYLANLTDGITFVHSPIRSWNPKDEKEQYDLVFVDDGHSYEEVKGDTEKAFCVNPKIIVIHDYPTNSEGDLGATIQKDIKKYVDEIKEKYNIKFGGDRMSWIVN